MNPAAGVPLHFTVEALGLGVAGVATAWAALTRRWTATAGAALIAAAQVAYAGQFFDPDAGGALATGVLRLAGLVLLSAGAWAAADRVALLSGCALVAGGTAWRMATDGGPASLAAGARALTAAGFVVLAVWAWRRASASVRSRIVAAFIGVLAVAVIVMGGAAARVSVTNALENAQSRIESAARNEQVVLDQRVTDLLNRVALASAVVTQSRVDAGSLTSLRDQAFPGVDLLSIVRRGGSDGDRLTGGVALASTTPVTAALRGRGATGAVATELSVTFLAAQPVFAAERRSPNDIVGALVAGFEIDAADLRSVTRQAGRRAGAILAVGNDISVVTPDYFTRESEGLNSGIVRIQVTEPPPVTLNLAQPLSSAADLSTAFPRALVGGVLVASLLAVVLALWLASRITRPILSLADEAERVKTDFLSTVSHELRTPLTPIRGYADLLRRGRVPRRRAEVYLDEIDDAARRLERIVTLLVEVSAMEAGRFTPELEPVSPAELLEEAADRWRSQSRRHAISVRVAKSIPRVNVDRRSIATVLDELIDNAIKFSPNGGSVEFRALRTSAGVEIAVVDEGIGLEPDALDQLTAAFVQAEPGETRRFGGIGLGLTFAAGVLAAHGTRLDVQSSPSAGTTFSFTLAPVGMVSRMSERARDGDVST